MGLFRGLNLLQSVEAQTTLGVGLQEILSGSEAQASEFGALLSTRHMARRMAGNAVTMAAVTSSIKAIQIVFEQTSEYNFRAVQEVAKDQNAVGAIARNKTSLDAVVDNSVAWSYFKTSEFYEENVIDVICTILEIDSSAYASVYALVSDTAAMFAIKSSLRAMKALVASRPAMVTVTGLEAPMQSIASNENAMTIVANDSISMHLIAQSSVALGTITDLARTVVIGIPSAILILASYNGPGEAWETILGSSETLHLTIKPLLQLLGGLDPDIFTSVTLMFEDFTASEAISNSIPAMMAIVYEAENAGGYFTGVSALTKLVASPNLGTVLGSLQAVTELSQSSVAMGLLITDPVAFPILLTSAAAKSAIFASGTTDPNSLFNVMMGNASAKAAIVATAKSATITNNASFATYKDSGISGNIIILTGVMGSIVATTLANYFRSGSSGTPSAAFNIPGTSLASGPIPIELPFTDMQWTINSIAATAAANLTFTYAEF